MSSTELFVAVLVGLGATLAMDLWNLFLRRAFAIPSLDYCLLGRWALHLPRGTFRHARIGAAASVRGECAAGWLVHYSIGATLAVAFVAMATPAWLTRPSLAPALFFGIVTVIFPFLLLQPALGLGVASSRAPSPARARLKSLATHAVFGVGLYLAAIGAVLARAALG